MSLDDNDELDGKAKKEEEIELEKGDVDLVREISPFHAKVGGDVLVYRPGKLVV